MTSSLLTFEQTLRMASAYGKKHLLLGNGFAMHLDGKLMQWARRKYQTLERREQASVEWLVKMKNCFPRMFFYWSVTRYSVG